MHKTKTELIELIADLKTKKDFEKEIKKRYKTYDELIDLDTIALLIVDKLGRNKQSITKIIDLAPDGDYTVIGRVLSISESKTFKRKNGTLGKVVNLEITDDTDTCLLVLWNGDIDYIKNKEIQPGNIVKIINGYTRLGYKGGMEINLGRWGLLDVEHSDINNQIENVERNGDTISGILIAKEATKAFFKDNGEFGFVTTITIKEHKIKKEVKLWNQYVKDIQAFKIGDTLTLKNVIKKWENGKTKFHLSHAGSIEKYK